jgi:hypothetical protein
VKKEKMKKAKGKVRGKSKAIIGMGMSVVMLTSVLVAMVPAVSGAPEADSGFAPFPVDPIAPSDFIILIKGTEDVNISAWTDAIGATDISAGQKWIIIVGAEDTYIEGETHIISDVTKFDVLEGWKEGPYGAGSPTAAHKIFAEEPLITTKIKLKDGTDVTNGVIAEDQGFYVEVTTNFGAVLGRDETPATIKLKVINPDGIKITTDDHGLSFLRDDVTTDKIRFPSNMTEYYKLYDIQGTYEITAKTSPVKPDNNMLYISASTVTLDLIAGEITIEVEEVEIMEGENVVVAGTGAPKTWYNLEIDTGGGEFKEGVKNVWVGSQVDPTTGFPTSGYPSNYAAVKTDAAGKYRAIIDTAYVSTGSYTVYIEKDTPDEDKVEYRLIELKVTFETDKTGYAMGEDVTISGTSPTGDYIIIAIDEVIMSHERIRADDTFKYKWIETETKPPSSYKIEVWNVPITVPGKDLYPVGSSSDAIPQHPDATAIIFLTGPSLTVELSTNEIALDDYFWIKGEAPGSDNLNILVVSPKGTSGTKIDTGTFAGLPTIHAQITSVSCVDYSFEHKVAVHEDSDTGNYLVVVLSPGCDKTYNGVGATVSEFMSSVIGVYALDCIARTQEQFLSIIMDATVNFAGSDDLFWMGYIRVQEGYVELNPTEDVEVGRDLVVTGKTNRADGHPILITVKSPVESAPKLAYIEEGEFRATFDTKGILTGTYIVTADDGDGHIDTTTASIIRGKISVSVSTDKKEYSPGDVMNTTIHLSNPTDNTQNLLFKWYLGVPDYHSWTKIMETKVNLPADSDLTFSIPIPVEDWGNKSFCGFYIASLTNTTTQKVVSVDSASWIYLPSTECKSKTSAEIVKEIKKGFEGVKLSI